jgi:hypothetical protein
LQKLNIAWLTSDLSENKMATECLYATSDKSTAAVSAAAEPVLSAIPPGNLIHKDNSLVPNRSNTSFAQAAQAEEPEPSAAPPPREVADLLS